MGVIVRCMCVDAPRWRCGRLDGCVWSLDEVRKVWICGCGRLGRTAPRWHACHSDSLTRVRVAGTVLPHARAGWVAWFRAAARRFTVTPPVPQGVRFQRTTRVLPLRLERLQHSPQVCSSSGNCSERLQTHSAVDTKSSHHRHADSRAFALPLRNGIDQ